MRGCGTGQKRKKHIDGIAYGRKITLALSSLYLICILAAGLSFTKPAQAQFSTKAKYAILIDATTNATLFEKKADDMMAPASMSKLMTLDIIFDGLKSGRLSMDDEFVVSENAWRKGGAPSGTSAMFVKLNSNVKLGELIKGIVVQSGNDACIVVAEGMSGSEEAFAERMNKHARKIGLKKSTFRNSTGLPNPDHLMTARELALLANHIIKTYPEYYELFKIKEYKYGRYKFFNRNPLVYSSSLNADGLKTGFTDDSGYGLVGSAVKDGRRLIVVVNGLKSKRERQTEAVKLLNWGFRNFKTVKIFNEGDIIGDARVWGGSKNFVKLTGDGPVRILLPRFQDPKLKASIVYQGPLKPPIKKGDQVAFIRVNAKNSTAKNEVPLYAAEDIERGGVVSRGLDSLLLLAFGWLL